ncbi:hypothetical protein BHE74_00010659 [Ensete ventricosum]|nr:hypothetical protein BHE74_00010659 [Ensete ventricosum]
MQQELSERHFNTQVYTRYLLQKLFGPGLLHLTGDNPLYLDLPSNMVLSLLSSCLTSGEFFRVKLNRVSDSAVLWLAFLVGPPGVWLRWRLARLNGRGIGSKQMLKWLPIGTLLANVLAAGIMAAAAIISKAVDTKRCTIIVSGFQLGFLGCLSTVSTFAAEIYGMWKTGHGWRAFFYIIVTIVPSFALGTLIYSVPVWLKHYAS